MQSGRARLARRISLSTSISLRRLTLLTLRRLRAGITRQAARLRIIDPTFSSTVSSWHVEPPLCIAEIAVRRPLRVDETVPTKRLCIVFATHAGYVIDQAALVGRYVSQTRRRQTERR